MTRARSCPAIPGLDLSLRARTALIHQGITTKTEISELSDEELLSFPSLGAGTLAEIREAMDRS